MKRVERSLNVDVLFDVLSRIPVKVLLGLKCISREWHSIISSSSFVKAQMQNTGLDLTGFIFQEKFTWCKEDIKTVGYIPVRAAGTKRSGGSKLAYHTVFDFLPEDVVILASCKGLVCCRSCLPCNSESNPVIYVCNPSNKEWVRIEWPYPNRNESIALAFDLGSNEKSTGCHGIGMFSMRFKLVRVRPVEVEDGEDEERRTYLTFELYSSEAKAWWKSNEICEFDHSLVKNKGVYIGGVLYWLTDGDQVLTFDVEKEMAWLIPVPVPAFEFLTVPEACIGEHEEKLHYVLVSENGLHVWFLEDYYEFNWTLKHWKSLDEIEAEFPKFFYNLKNRVSQRLNIDTSPWMNPLGFKDGVLLLKVCVNLYLYDIKNSNMSQACSLQDLDSKSMPYPTVFPHCLSLFPLNHHA